MTMNLREYLLKKKIKQVSIAKKLAINPSLISLHVNGYKQLPDYCLPAFCDYLNIDLIGYIEGKIKELKK